MGSLPQIRFLKYMFLKHHGRDKPGHDLNQRRTGYRSTHMAMPMPPPIQRVANPFLALRFCIS
jgi:hypothetical protein